MLPAKDEKFKDSARYAWAAVPGTSTRPGKPVSASPTTTAPIEPEYRSLSIPDSDRIWYSAGATYHINPDMSLDFGMAYLDGKEVDVNEGLRKQRCAALEGHLPRQRPAGFRPVQHEILIFMSSSRASQGALFYPISPIERTAVVNNCTLFFFIKLLWVFLSAFNPVLPHVPLSRCLAGHTI